MITINDHKQQELFDPWAFLSPKRRQLVIENNLEPLVFERSCLKLATLPRAI